MRANLPLLVASILVQPTLIWALSTPTTVTKPTKALDSSDDTRNLFKGGADKEAFYRSHVARTKEFEPTTLRMDDLPSDFPSGTYFKNGPGGYESDDGIPYLHPFDCNGKVLAITLDSKSKEAVYRYKHVNTPKYQQDVSTGTMSERGFFGTKRAGGWLGNIFQGMDPKNPANTNIVLNDSQDRLFALWEAGRPFELDPYSLETKGENNLGFLDASTSFSAHPSYDPRTKTFINFCNSRPSLVKGTTTVTFQEVDATNFQPVNQGVSLDIPGIMTTHDMILSENYVVFNWVEAVISGPKLLQALLGRQPPFGLVETVKRDTARFILIPRELLTSGVAITDIFQDDRIHIVEAPFHVAIHYTNAYERDGKLTFEAACFQGHSYGVEEMVETGKPLWEAYDYDNSPPTTLQQFEIDLATKRLTKMETIADQAIEFCTIPRHLLTQQHRYVFSCGAHNEDHHDKPTMAPYGSIRKIDLQTKEQQIYSFEPHEFVQDGDVVLKAGNNNKKEDAVYFVTVITNGRDLTSDLVIMDGEDIAAGPVARLRLPEIIPNGGIHGNFYDGATCNS